MHGTNEHSGIYAEVARQLYVTHLSPDYAYVPIEKFYEFSHFDDAYAKAAAATTGFTNVSVADLEPGRCSADRRAISKPSRISPTPSTVGALCNDMRRRESRMGCSSTSAIMAVRSVSYWMRRLNSVEGLSRTRSKHSLTSMVSATFGPVRTTRRRSPPDLRSLYSPPPDFVVFDDADNLRALLECKGANDGGTARDKALRFERLRDESVRLGGIPLIAILGGLGWTRVNDTLGPVVRDCDGRVFSVSNLEEMMTVAPFASLTQ
jgi:hypothetical protein